MPKSLILPLRRWPCWPGPYSRRLTGPLGRPKTFSPMRRSSLYLALVRFDIRRFPIRVSSRSRTRTAGLACPEPCRGASDAITASPGVRDQLRAAHLGERLSKVKVSSLFGPAAGDRRARLRQAVIGLVDVGAQIAAPAAAVERRGRCRRQP